MTMSPHLNAVPEQTKSAGQYAATGNNRLSAPLYLPHLLWGVAVLVLLAIVWTWRAAPPLQQQVVAAVGGAGVGFVATMLGALVLFLPGKLRQQRLDQALSLSGGMMLAAAIFSLLIPSEQAMRALIPGATGQLWVVLAVLAGAVAMSLLEKMVPHGHPVAGDSGPGYQNLNRLWLFVSAIALHNLPEGLAVGVSFSGNDAQQGLSVTVAIAMQDVPEGFAMAMVLLKLGVRPWQAMGWSLLAALLEPLGALLAVMLSQWLGALLALTYPLALALAAGAMLFVVVHEVIPETHSAGFGRSPRSSSFLMLAGFLFLWFLDSEAFVHLW